MKIKLIVCVFQTLRQTIQMTPSSISQWSEDILSYEGIPDFPAFESYREELLPPRKLDL